EVGAFIYEPLVQAAAGMRMYSSEILDRLMLEAKKKDVVCIADEVFTGFGRTGKMFASDYLTQEPDIVAISKGLTGGTMALGVTSCSERILAPFRSSEIERTFFHGHSYTANPIACAAGNASFELLLQEDCQRQIGVIERKHKMFREKLVDRATVEEVRQIGTILAIELKTTEKSSYFNKIRKEILPYFLSKNILLRPLGNVIYIVPPYVITTSELDQIYNCIEQFLLETGART
ncbi:MAG TPA: aminotransferase class III-fold pyridoxal phosphate-dependent enzyme, partial [Chryseolinea sp.]